MHYDVSFKMSNETEIDGKPYLCGRDEKLLEIINCPPYKYYLRGTLFDIFWKLVTIGVYLWIFSVLDTPDWGVVVLLLAGFAVSEVFRISEKQGAIVKFLKANGNLELKKTIDPNTTSSDKPLS